MSFRKVAPRTILALGLAAGIATALAGCLFPAAPESTESASPEANCTPDTATIFWNKSAEGGRVTVGAYVLPGTEAVEGTEIELIDRAPEAEFSGDGLNMLTDFDSTTVEEWHTALLEDARQTGQVDRDFGEQVPLPEDPVSTVEFDAPGTGVQVMSRPQLSMPFEIRCAGLDPIEGTIFSVSNSTLANTFFLCTDTIELTSPEAELARELCLSA